MLFIHSFKKTSRIVLFAGLVLGLSPLWTQAQGKKLTFPQETSKNSVPEEPDSIIPDIRTVHLINPEDGKPFPAVIVTHPDFDPTLSEREESMTESVGIFGYGVNNKTFTDQFLNTLPTIIDYLVWNPQAAVCVPNTFFSATARAGGIDACGHYLSDPDGEVRAEKLGLLAESMGANGAVHYLVSKDKYATVRKVRLAILAYPREMHLDNLGDMITAIDIFVGTADIDSEANEDARGLFNALNTDNPALPKKLKEYRDGKHGFYLIHDDETPAGHAGAEARAESYEDLERAMNIIE